MDNYTLAKSLLGDNRKLFWHCYYNTYPNRRSLKVLWKNNTAQEPDLLTATKVKQQQRLRARLERLADHVRNSDPKYRQYGDIYGFNR